MNKQGRPKTGKYRKRQLENELFDEMYEVSDERELPSTDLDSNIERAMSWFD